MESEDVVSGLVFSSVDPEGAGGRPTEGKDVVSELVSSVVVYRR